MGNGRANQSGNTRWWLSWKILRNGHRASPILFVAHKHGQRSDHILRTFSLANWESLAVSNLVSIEPTARTVYYHLYLETILLTSSRLHRIKWIMQFVNVFLSILGNNARARTHTHTVASGTVHFSCASCLLSINTTCKQYITNSTYAAHACVCEWVSECPLKIRYKRSQKRIHKTVVLEINFSEKIPWQHWNYFEIIAAHGMCVLMWLSTVYTYLCLSKFDFDRQFTKRH